MTEQEAKTLCNQELLQKYAQKAIDHKISGNYEDYLESVTYYVEIMRRLEAREA